MGRPRQYATAAARQAAYRQRMHATTIWVDRAPFERMARAIDMLQEATWCARKQGSLMARELERSTPVETLEATVNWIVHRLQREHENAQDVTAVK